MFLCYCPSTSPLCGGAEVFWLVFTARLCDQRGILYFVFQTLKWFAYRTTRLSWRKYSTLALFINGVYTCLHFDLLILTFGVTILCADEWPHIVKYIKSNFSCDVLCGWSVRGVTVCCHSYHRHHQHVSICDKLLIGAHGSRASSVDEPKQRAELIIGPQCEHAALCFPLIPPNHFDAITNSIF